MFPFSYDHAVAVTKYLDIVATQIFNFILSLFSFFPAFSYDLWGPFGRGSTPSSSSAIVGYCVLGGICSSNRYSIIEEFSFNSISVSENIF